MPDTRPEPLARLFLSAASLLVDQLHAGMAEIGWTDIRHSWGFVLGRVDAGPASVSELATFLGVTKQAASKTVDQMTGAGLVQTSVSPADARVRLVEITDRGCAFRADAERIYAGIEAEWATTIGEAALEQMRDYLVTLIRGLHEGSMPPPAPLS